MVSGIYLPDSCQWSWKRSQPSIAFSYHVFTKYFYSYIVFIARRLSCSFQPMTAVFSDIDHLISLWHFIMLLQMTSDQRNWSQMGNYLLRNVFGLKKNLEKYRASASYKTRRTVFQGLVSKSSSTNVEISKALLKCSNRLTVHKKQIKNKKQKTNQFSSQTSHLWPIANKVIFFNYSAHLANRKSPKQQLVI